MNVLSIAVFYNSVVSILYDENIFQIVVDISVVKRQKNCQEHLKKY